MRPRNRPGTIFATLMLVLFLAMPAAETVVVAMAGKTAMAQEKPSGALRLRTRGGDSERRARRSINLGSGYFRVALLLPLSGHQKDVGRALLDAAQMALFDIGHPAVALMPFDTRGTPDGAAVAAEAAVRGGAHLILGPLLRQSVVAAAPIARGGGLDLVAFSTDRSLAGNGVFLLAFLPYQQIERVVSYAIDQGYERFAALIPDNAYGRIVLEAFYEVTEAYGAEVTAVEIYPMDLSKLFGPVRRLADYDRRRAALLARRRVLEAMGTDADARLELRQLEKFDTLGEPDFEAILIPEGGQMLQALIPVLPYFDIDPMTVQFLGTGLWDDPDLVREPVLAGGWFAGPPPGSASAFAARYADHYGRQPPRIASLAYDAVLIAALHAGGTGVPRDLLLSPDGFRGLDGVFRFRSDGTAERGLAVIQITGDGFEIISPMPTTFETGPE